MEKEDKQIKRRLNVIIWVLWILTFFVVLYVLNYGYHMFGWFH